jgi:hypothetical protein
MIGPDPVSGADVSSDHRFLKPRILEMGSKRGPFDGLNVGVAGTVPVVFFENHNSLKRRF